MPCRTPFSSSPSNTPWSISTLTLVGSVGATMCGCTPVGRSLMRGVLIAAARSCPPSLSISAWKMTSFSLPASLSIDVGTGGGWKKVVPLRSPHSAKPPIVNSCGFFIFMPDT